MKQASNYNIYDTTHEAWKAMYESIERAQKTVYWEVYILVDDEEGNKFFDLLIQKSRNGVDVKLVVDYWGSFWLSRKKISELKNAGIDIQIFEGAKRSFRFIHRGLTKRTHRKILVVDENIGFIGGVNIQKNMKDWDDIHVMVRGKIVRSLLRSFARSYLMCGGERKKIRHLLKYRYRVEHNQIDFVYDDADEYRSKARKKYVEALMKARERVILFSPYYFPDKKLLQAMWKARKRGVRIDLLIPFRTDVRIATYAAYAWFSLMHGKGIKIHLLKKMMHGKGVVVDDDWAMVGSSNLEHSSFYHNREANIRLRDRKAVKKLKRILERWINESKLFDEIRWKRRGRFHKFKEKVATKLYKFWFNIK